MPLASEGVAHHEVELRAVKRRFAVLNHVREALVLGGLDDGLLGFVPVFGRADVLARILGVAQAHLGLKRRKIQSFEDVQHQVNHLHELVEELVRGTEQVGVVLRESAHAGQAVQLAALLVAVHGSELGKAKRKVAVRTRLRLVNLAVVRAVHRLEQVLFALFGSVNGLERVLAVLLVVARTHVQLFVANVRGDDGQVARLFLGGLQKVFEAFAQRSPFGQPEGQALTDALAERKQFELAAELAVVALFGFLEQHEVLLEHAGLRKRNAVHPRQLRVFLIAAPVSTGHVHDFGRLDVARIWDVSASAEVGEVRVVAERNGAVFEVLDQFRFERIPRVGSQCFGLGYGAHAEFRFFARKLEHLLFNLGKVALAKGFAAEVDVVVEAGFDGRTNGQVRVGVEVKDGLRQNVRRGVPKRGFAFRLVPGEEYEGSAVGQGLIQFYGLPVPFGGKGILGESAANGFGHLHGGGSGGIRTDRAVGEGNVNHGFATSEEGPKVGRVRIFAGHDARRNFGGFEQPLRGNADGNPRY